VKRCIIFSASKIESYKKININICSGDYIICADGGYLHAKALGIKPHLLIGDFDSLAIAPDDDVKTEKYPAEKDDTDTMLAIKNGFKNGCDEFLIIGGLGGELHHILANIQSLKYALDRNAKAVLEDDKNTVEMINCGSRILNKSDGELVSLFAYSPKCEGLSIKGVKYPLERVVLDNAFPLGVSNKITDEFATVTVENGDLLIVVTK